MENFLLSFPNLQKLSGILNTPITFIDLETTGMVHERNFAIIEIGLVFITEEFVKERNYLVNPKMKIPPYISKKTNIYDYMVKDKRDFSYFAPYIQKVAKNHILCGFNSKSFDSKGMEKMLQKYAIYDTFGNQLDFRSIFLRCRKHFDKIGGSNGNLTEACKHHEIVVSNNQTHRAKYDIKITTLLAEKLLEKYGFGIIYKDIEGFSNLDIRKRYHKYIVENKIKILI